MKLPFIEYIQVLPKAINPYDAFEYYQDTPSVVKIELPKIDSPTIIKDVVVSTEPKTQRVVLNPEIYASTPVSTEEPVVVEQPVEDQQVIVGQTYANPYRTDQAFSIKLKPGRYDIPEGVVVPEHIQEVANELAKRGMRFVITRGLDDKLTAQGNPSRHNKGEAWDIIPHGVETWDDLRLQAYNADFINYLKSLGWNLLDETDPKIMKKTGATGPHWHITKEIPFAKKGVKFIQPHPLSGFTSYNDYTTPEVTDGLRQYFGKNSDNARKIIVKLKDAGWNNRQIAAYLGNVYVESKADPNIRNKKGGDYGLIQRVGDRAEPTRSIPGLALDSQVEYDIDVMAGKVPWQEMSNEWPNKRLRNKFLKGTSSVYTLTSIFMNGYERPSEKGKLSLPRRQAAAWEVYKFLK